MSIWIPSELKDDLIDFCSSYPDRSRNAWVCHAIKEFLGKPSRKYRPKP